MILPNSVPKISSAYAVFCQSSAGRGSGGAFPASFPPARYKIKFRPHRNDLRAQDYNKNYRHLPVMSPAKVLPSPSPSANYFGVTACGDTTHIFNTCVMDLLFAPSGVTYPSIEDFCKPLSFQGDWKWYSCLCSKTQTLNLCYSTNCPGDESYSTALKTQDQYCASAAQYAPTNTTASTAWWTSTEGPTLAIPTEINAVTSKVGENAIKSGADVSVFDAVVAFAVLVGIF